MAIGEGFEEVLASAQAGDDAALAVIYRDTAPLVLGFLRSNRVTEADDVAGDVFVSLVQGLSGFSGTEHQFRSWLLTTAHRRMVDDVRRRVRQPEPVAIDDPDHEREQRQTIPLEREAMTNLACRELADAMDELSDLQREAMMLRALADLTVPEIARVMGKPESAVKALLRRATANLEKALDTSGSLLGDAVGGEDEGIAVTGGRRRRIGSRSTADHSGVARTSGSDGGRGR